MAKLEDIKVEAKYRFNDLKAKVRYGWCKFTDWVSNNQEMIMIATPLAIGAIAEGRKVFQQVSTTANKKKEQDHRDYDVWDPSAGVHLRCKRKLTNADRIEFSYRHSKGEATVDILRDMGLL